MLAQRIQQHFFDGADLKFQSAEALARPIEDAAQALVSGFTAGGRLWVVGLGPGAALAELVTTHLVGRFERARPGLAVQPLGTNGPLLSALATDDGLEQALAHQVRTLGQPGDLLLVLGPVAGDSPGRLATLLAAVQAAHAREMTVLALAGRDEGALRDALGETDVLVSIPHDRAARVLEMQLLVLHCLCDAIDHQLLGEQESA